MKLSFKYVVYVLILIGFTTFTFTTCSRHVIHPLFDKTPEFQEGLVFQKTQEAKIQAAGGAHAGRGRRI